MSQIADAFSRSVYGRVAVLGASSGIAEHLDRYRDHKEHGQDEPGDHPSGEKAGHRDVHPASVDDQD